MPEMGCGAVVYGFGLELVACIGVGVSKRMLGIICLDMRAQNECF